MAFTYLALGDSYTIAEGCLLTESYAYQAVQQLRNNGIEISAPEIIAKTGYTSSELLAALQAVTLLPAYDIVTLLVGVNNQYRGLDINEFKNEFLVLLKRAIQLTGNRSQSVVVLSIPNWGVTPFASGQDGHKITAEIEAYNGICEEAALLNNCNYINITMAQAARCKIDGYLAADGLHPSGKEYTKWASLLSEIISRLLPNTYP
ncbi:MAG: hypothetical protein RL172_2161 [Bacteroidota bacterium]|jgi:lysophospholipase L1-like esterase